MRYKIQFYECKLFNYEHEKINVELQIINASCQQKVQGFR